MRDASRFGLFVCGGTFFRVVNVRENFVRPVHWGLLVKVLALGVVPDLLHYVALPRKKFRLPYIGRISRGLDALKGEGRPARPKVMLIFDALQGGSPHTPALACEAETPLTGAR